MRTACEGFIFALLEYSKYFDTFVFTHHDQSYLKRFEQLLRVFNFKKEVLFLHPGEAEEYLRR